MKRSIHGTFLAAVTALALVACSTGSGNNVPSTPFPTTNTAPSTTGNAILSLIVGVGDSLTAGYESGALIGVTAANPLFPGTSPLPIIPSGQDHGFWADFYSAAKGGASPLGVLPLIKNPGSGQFLVPTNTGGFTALQTSCSGINASVFDPAATLSTARVNGAIIPLDLGVPGQMVHEALYQIAPQGPCPVVNVAPGSLFQSESTQFYPVLANFPGLSQVRAAASLHPTLTTVFLGANDLLKYALSNGAFGPTPTSSIQADILTTVQTLNAAGSQVLLSNLPDVLLAPLFIPIQNLPFVLNALGIPLAAAQGISAGVAAQNGLGAGSYVTLQGLPAIAAVAQGAPIPTLGQGQALTAAFAAQVQSLNNSYNAAIAAVAQQTNAGFVDFRTSFAQLMANGYPINPPKCCSPTLTGGLFSYDGIHPSYTGYAIMANLFINATNAKWGTTIAPYSVLSAYAVDPYAPH